MKSMMRIKYCLIPKNVNNMKSIAKADFHHECDDDLVGADFR
jgi:hypothetical protein